MFNNLKIIFKTTLFLEYRVTSQTIKYRIEFENEVMMGWMRRWEGDGRGRWMVG